MRSPPPSPDGERRPAAKRNNERVRLIATSFSAIALAISGAAFMGGGLLWMWLQVRRFGRTYGHTDTRPPGQ